MTDAAALTAEYDTPTMQAADCVVCHKIVDPIAGLFQDYDEDGHVEPRKEGWYRDMFAPGFEGEAAVSRDLKQSLPWLGRRTADDPRFAVAMVEHVYYILMGRPVMLPPQDIHHPQFKAKRAAYAAQRQLIEQTAARFAEENYNLKIAFKTLIASKFYRADGPSKQIADPQRRVELEDVGIVRMLTPEQLERKIGAIFGERWGRLEGRESKLKILYGGIDSKSVTERMLEPSGAMGAIQRIMANDIACRHTAADFALPPSQRRLFPAIEPSDLPGEPASDERIREAIVHLHHHILGRECDADDREVERTFELFVGIIADARASEGLDRRGSYFCERIDGRRLDDANYTLRAWRGVVTYLLRQHEFLYE